MAHNIASDLQKDEYKVIIIGALGVGKTSLLLRYVHNTFEDRISKFISEEKKSVLVNGREIVLHLWDTAGVCVATIYSLVSISSTLSKLLRTRIDTSIYACTVYYIATLDTVMY